MLGLLKRAAVALVLAIIVVAAGAYLLVRASLPQLDGEIALAGIDSAVTIQRDGMGIPVIRAADREALAFGTGFVHAQDRFFQMDLLRRRAAGELSALVGPAALGLDSRNRVHRFRARSTAVLDRMSDDERAVLEAYTNGVNAGLDSLGSRPFEYWLLGVRPEPWQVGDTVMAGYSMFLELNDEMASRDTGRGVAERVLPEQVFTFLYPGATEWDAPLLDEPATVAHLPDVDRWPGDMGTKADLAGLVDEYRDDSELLGSNNWAVSGALTESGRAIVANDMHLGIRVPNTWYRARLVQTGDEARDVSGVTLPGTPVVVTGSNGKVAWGFTNSNGDWTDAVLLKPGAAENSYLTESGGRDIETFEELIEVKDGDPVTLTVRETIWGPLRPAGDFPEGDVAISWIAHHPEAVNFDHLRLETAGSVEEALDVANGMGIPPQNFVVGDASGQIAWTIAGKIPRRGGAAETVPGDWSDGSGWQGWLPVEEYPRIVNPPAGRIWTANARVAGGERLRLIGDGGYDLGARQMQIRDALLARETFDIEDMLTIHLDDRALFLARWRDLLLEVLDENALRGRPARASYRRLVENWVPRAATESVGYRLVRTFRSTVSERVFRELVAAPAEARYGPDVPLRRSRQFEGPLWQLVTERPTNFLPPGAERWEDVLLESVDAVLEAMDDEYGDALANRSWGERNTAAIRHPLSQALPFLSATLDMLPEPLPGDSHMPRVQGPVLGASERFAVSPGAEESGYLHMPGGQSGHPLSPHYRDGHAAWTSGSPTPFQPGEAQNTLRLVPVGD